MTLRADICSPSMPHVVRGTLPPLYKLGWRYNIDEYCERFNGDQCDPFRLFNSKIRDFVAAQQLSREGCVEPTLNNAANSYFSANVVPELAINYTDKTCLVFLATNYATGISLVH